MKGQDSSVVYRFLYRLLMKDAFFLQKAVGENMHFYAFFTFLRR